MRLRGSAKSHPIQVSRDPSESGGTLGFEQWGLVLALKLMTRRRGQTVFRSERSVQGETQGYPAHCRERLG
jgi:hypothetical protein